jgi:hypothetical protein
MLKFGKVLLPDWETQRDPDTDTRPVDDFLNMFTESRRGFAGDILCVRKDSGKSDDFVHAVNFLASACWFRSGAYPDVPPGVLGGKENLVTDADVEAAEGEWTDDWDDDGNEVYTA